jgi:hypothetical protein
MHVLNDANYKRLKRQISRDIISFMQAHPDSPDAYLVQFDYSSRQNFMRSRNFRQIPPGFEIQSQNGLLYRQIFYFRTNGGI